jgi:hypothetical protein
MGKILDPRPRRDGPSLIDESPQAASVSPSQTEEVLSVGLYLLERGSRGLSIPKVRPSEELIQVRVSCSIFGEKYKRGLCGVLPLIGTPFFLPLRLRNGEFGPEDRLHVRRLAGLLKPNGTLYAILVGESDGPSPYGRRLMGNSLWRGTPGEE